MSLGCHLVYLCPLTIQPEGGYMQVMKGDRNKQLQRSLQDYQGRQGQSEKETRARDRKRVRQTTERDRWICHIGHYKLAKAELVFKAYTGMGKPRFMAEVARPSGLQPMEL